MRTVDKALKLLNLFTTASPEAGLSDIARASGIDKATTLRMLGALTRHGLLEQHPETRKYRLGPAVLTLARVREASFPIVAVIQPVLDRLTLATGETAHASLASRTAMTTVAIAEPQRSTRVFVDPSEPLPFHATASGMVWLAYGPPEATEDVLGAAAFPAITGHTPTSPAALRRQVARVREAGFAVAARTFEDEVIGIAAPVFDWSGYAQGAVAVASVASRLTEVKEQEIASAVLAAATEITRALGAEPHPDFVAASERLAA